MNCALCHDEGVANPPNGVCTCGLSVCLPPPRRADRVFHGERCQCTLGGGKVHCRATIANHLVERHDGHIGCFPRTGLAVSWPLLAMAGVAGEHPPDELVALPPALAATATELLNTLTPGHRILGGVLPAGLVATDAVTWAAAGAVRIEPAASFFTAGRCRALYALAADTLLQVFERTDPDRLRIHGERPWALPLVENLLTAQLNGHLGEAEKAFDDIQQATRAASRLFPDRERAVNWRWSRPPHDATARARWLVAAGSLEQLQLDLA